ncbi:MAG: hypothetical protein JST04_11590 [Bdellovibrionales bacterium]|nr:hypothetical protein [Bdellovibrionales bacterium]
MKKLALALLSTSILGCAHPYTLDPLGEKPEYANGIALSNATLPKCVVQAGYQYSNPKEMLVKIRVTNRGKASFDVSPSDFSLVGPPETLKSSPLGASDPDKYLKELKALAETLDARTHMESYQGVQELGALKGENSDSQIEAAKDAYKKKASEAEDARKEAAAVRARIAVIEPAIFRKTTVKHGSLLEGALVFKADFGETGVVTLESDIADCPAKIRFMLKK